MTDAYIINEFIKRFLNITACAYVNDSGEYLYKDNGELVVSTKIDDDTGEFIPPFDVGDFNPFPMFIYNEGEYPKNVQLPNRVIKRNGAELWFEVFWLPGNGIQTELHGRNLYAGVVQVNINVDLNAGTDLVDFAYEQIRAKFRHSEYFNGIRVMAPTSRTSARTFDDYYSVPVSIYLQTLLEN